jgi:hypothetical protein
LSPTPSIARRVLQVDDTRATPAERIDDGQDFQPTDRRVLGPAAALPGRVGRGRDEPGHGEVGGGHAVVVFDTTLDTVLTALFASLIVIILIDSIRVWVTALRGGTLSSGSEDPHVKSTIFAPVGPIPTEEERAVQREPLPAGTGREET